MVERRSLRIKMVEVNYETMNSLREDGGASVCFVNNDCNEVSFGKRTSGSKTRCGDMKSCPSSFSVANTTSVENISMQDLNTSIQVESSSIEKCERSSFFLGIDKPMDELGTEDVVGVEFETLEKAEVFYYTYSNVLGFSVRKDDVRRDKNGLIVLRKWVCSKEGQRRQKHLERVDRKRAPRLLTRVGCCAAFRVNYSQKKGKWIAKEFVSRHSHQVSGNKGLLSQDLHFSTQVVPYCLEKYETSSLYFGIEKSMHELATKDVVGMEFETLEKAEAFYYTYSNHFGFSIRKNDVRRDKDGSIILRRWVCSKEGQRRQKHLERIDRKREPRALTRVGCCAAFRVNYCSKKGKWIAKEFVSKHTHQWATTQELIIPADRYAKDPAIAQEKLKDNIEDGEKGNTDSVQLISSLREEVGSNKGCYPNNDCHEGSCSGRTDDYEMECGDTRSCHGGSSEENVTSKKDLSMQSCHGDFTVENAASNKDLSMQDLDMSTQVGPYCLERCEQSSFYLGNDKRIDELITENVVGLEFETLEKAEAFYYMYSSVVGFNVRKDDLKRDKHGSIILRRWVCSKQGQRRQKHLERVDRKRKPKALTRVGCCAAFRVNYNPKKGKWIAREFVSTHTHQLAAAQKLTPLKSNCNMKDSDLAQSKEKDKVVDGREGSTSGVQPRTCGMVHEITLPPWTLTMPKIDKGTQLIKIPRVNEVEGLPLPDDVQHVNPETVTVLLQMIGGLHEVVMETILQARDKLKEASEQVQQKDREIAELRDALKSYKHAHEDEGNEESNNDDPTEVRIFGGIINLNDGDHNEGQGDGNECVTDKGGEVGRKNKGRHGSDKSSVSYPRENKSKKKHNLKDVEASDRSSKKAKKDL